MPAELNINTSLVRQLIAAQFPEWGNLVVRPVEPRSVIRITSLSLLTLNSISLALRSAPSAYACYASGAVLARG